jgi:hypothetical protein
MKKPCARCGHAYEVHAPDRNFPNTQRCFHRAVTGEGCAEKYDDRCKDYVDPEVGA